MRDCDVLSSLEREPLKSKNEFKNLERASGGFTFQKGRRLFQYTPMIWRMEAFCSLSVPISVKIYTECLELYYRIKGANQIKKLHAYILL